MLESASLLILALGGAAFCLRRMYRYLRFLQQEEYNNVRFLRWLWERRVFDRRGSVIAAIIAIPVFMLEREHSLATLLLSLFGALLLVAVAFSEEDPRRVGKIKLKMTARAKRIYRTSAAVFLIVMLLFLLGAREFGGESPVFCFWIALILLVQSVPLMLVLAVLFLKPGEKSVQAGFLAEAKELFTATDPFVVGITGSYGKTSTKAVLGKLLDITLGPTFWPQKGVNTQMGITREIRERLSPRHKYAVVEMGAYTRGSINRLCQLTPPQAAIITAVGLMHLERFGSAENIFRAKSELAQEVPTEGILVCNGDNPGARRIADNYPKATTLLYGLEPEKGGLSSWLSEISFTKEGSRFSLHWQGETYPGFTPLHGRPSLSNILAAFTMACALGAEPEYVLGTIRNLEPVDNRLQVVSSGGFTQINDAYNSNPIGFAAALEVLEQLPGERKILVTPGMIELGDAQEEQNTEIARSAARICDLVLVVGELNREPLRKGLIEGGMEQEQILLFEERDPALKNLAEMRREGDVVLLENDLPDLYEMDLRF